MKINWYKIVGAVVGIAGVALIAMNKYVVTGTILFCVSMFLIWGNAEKVLRFFLKEEEKKDAE